MNESAKKLTALTAVTLGASTMLHRRASGSDTWAENGRIIYISCEMGVCDPHTSKDDGTGEKPIVITGFEDTPTISDNGKRIAFRQGGDIWVAKSDGTDLDNITETAGVQETEPDISPDGKSIVYTSFDGSAGDIVRSKIDGSDVEPLLDGTDRRLGPGVVPRRQAHRLRARRDICQHRGRLRHEEGRLGPKAEDRHPPEVGVQSHLVTGRQADRLHPGHGQRLEAEDDQGHPADR